MDRLQVCQSICIYGVLLTIGRIGILHGILTRRDFDSSALRGLIPPGFFASLFEVTTAATRIGTLKGVTIDSLTDASNKSKLEYRRGILDTIFMGNITLINGIIHFVHFGRAAATATTVATGSVSTGGVAVLLPAAITVWRGYAANSKQSLPQLTRRLSTV